jgi:site-specific DNA-methyltransferase (adenine-specific)
MVGNASYPRRRSVWWKKKGADSGIDGLFYFKPATKATQKGIISVKGGENVNLGMIRDLAHVVKREKAEMGIFITLIEPTKPMLAEAVKEGFYDTAFGRFPRLQILTVDRLLNGEVPKIPPTDESSIRRAQREDTSKQEGLPF